MLEHDEPDTTQAVSTEEEMDAVAALLSLGEVGNETLDDNNENAELMPIGGQNVPLDVAPQPIRLDQLSVDNAIADMTQVNDQLEDTAASAITANMKTEEQAEVQTVAKPGDATKDNTSGTKKYIISHTTSCKRKQSRPIYQGNITNKNLHLEEEDQYQTQIF